MGITKAPSSSGLNMGLAGFRLAFSVVRTDPGPIGETKGLCTVAWFVSFATAFIAFASTGGGLRSVAKGLVER